MHAVTFAVIFMGADAARLRAAEPISVPDQCSKIKCGELECKPPAEVISEGLCCPICKVNVGEPVPSMEHMSSWYASLTTPNEKAPTSCLGAFCGTPLCAKGF